MELRSSRLVGVHHRLIVAEWQFLLRDNNKTVLKIRPEIFMYKCEKRGAQVLVNYCHSLIVTKRRRRKINHEGKRGECNKLIHQRDAKVDSKGNVFFFFLTIPLE